MQMIGRVVILPENPPKNQMLDYLVWLSTSIFDYHIDDDPRDIWWEGVDEGITDEELQQLCDNSRIMWNSYDPDTLWKYYPVLRELDEISQELYELDYGSLYVSAQFEVQDEFKKRLN